jgi:nucleotide-binding universal stress UspA family protein
MRRSTLRAADALRFTSRAAAYFSAPGCVIFPNTAMLCIARQGFLRGTRIALNPCRRALRNHATRKSMKKAMKILLAVDGSEASLAAVEEAARTPWPEGSVVRIVSATEVPFPTQQWAAPMPAGSYEEWDRIFEERSVENTAQAMARFGEVAGAQTEARAKTLKGDPKIAILDEAEHWGADLIFVGTHGYNALERLWLGSVSRAVASHAKCSVEIARRRKVQGVDGKAMRILLAVDGSEFGDAAVEEIATRPWPPGSEVHVISVIHLPFTPTPETWALPDSYYSQLEKAGREMAESVINRAVSRLRESDAERETPLTLTSEAIVGRPAETIIEMAKKCGADLVALGSHGRRGFTRFLLGSVSYAVASHAPCSVEIVRKSILHEGEK